MKRYVITGGAVVLALLVVVIVANPPSNFALLMAGGKRAALFGMAMLALIPLLGVVQIGLGAALARCFAGPVVLEETWLLWLSGSAVFSLIGVVLAVAGLINAWVCGGALVAGVAYTMGSGACDRPLRQLSAWLRLRDAVAGRPAFAAVRIAILLGLFLIGLRAATGELNDTDFVQFYWGWFNEVRHLGGVRLSAELPLYQNFAQGRGNGAYLLLAGVAPGLVSHVVSAVYCIMFAVLLRVFVLRTDGATGSRATPLIVLAADMACLAALWMLPGAVAFGKYHLQFAAWALGFLLVCLFIVRDDDALARARRLLMMPLAVAIAFGLAQFEAFVALIFVVVLLAAPNRWRSVPRLFPLLIAGGGAAVLSLAANWLYLGIPDFNPFPLFERFIFESRFALRTSRLQQDYINYIQGGALAFKAGDGVSKLRELRSLFAELRGNLGPILLVGGGFVGVVVLGMTPLRARWAARCSLLVGVAFGYVLYTTSSQLNFTALALSPALNRLVLYSLGACLYLWAARPWSTAASRPFVLGLLGYWLICATFTLVFHSGSMERLMRHAEVVGVALLLIALARRVPDLSVYAVGLRLDHHHWHLRMSRHAVAAMLLAVGIMFSFRAAVATRMVDSPRQLLASTFGLKGRAIGLTNPMARFERCDEIAGSVPADARVLFLNAYTAMAYCNNAVLLPRKMVVGPHESDYARDIATSSFADADTVERSLHELQINHFLVLKGDVEFWTSGLSAPFRPGELERRFDLLTETPSFYVLTWKGGGKAIPTDIVAAITELRRFNLQQSGFMAQNEFVGQWRAMANLGADRPKYKLGGRVDFRSSGWSALYADHGWYAAEPHGTWTVGPVATLTLPLARPEAGPLRVKMEVMPFVIPQLPRRIVHVKLGPSEVATWSFGLGEDYQEKQFDLPAGAGASGTIALTFEIENAVSQYVLRLNKDWRPLGVAVRSLVIKGASAETSQ